MSGVILNLIIEIVGGAVGGNAIGAALKNVSLGTAGNTIIGAIGGGLGGQIIEHVVPLLGAGSTDVGTMVGQLVGGGAAGAILTAIAGIVKNAMTGQQPSS
jgi:hypothetical protein